MFSPTGSKKSPYEENKQLTDKDV